MSYLSHPKIYFSGKFRADPSTVNNTPDNYNPNNQFPPLEGINGTNNIQTYWNPNGTGQFLLDCQVSKVSDDLVDMGLVGQSLASTPTDFLNSAKIVDLDPMQQNVSELWALKLQLGGEKGFPMGDFAVTAFWNIWGQVIGGRGDYAGSAIYQSVLTFDDATVADNPQLSKLLTTIGGVKNQLSIAFVVRSFNGSAVNYLFADTTMQVAAALGVPANIIKALAPLRSFRQYAPSKATVGYIPTSGFLEKSVKALIGTDNTARYLDLIKQATEQPYEPLTPWEFTYGQVFGAIGASVEDEPDHMPNRVMAPVSGSPLQFAQLGLDEVAKRVTVNLGNSLPSTSPAAGMDSYVASALLGQLQLCYFDSEIAADKAKVIGDIDYSHNDFYVVESGLAGFALTAEELNAVKSYPLGILSSVNGGAPDILLAENAQGLYLRADDFVYRMNPGVDSTTDMPRGKSQSVAIYAYQFGQPLAQTDIRLKLKSQIESTQYANQTLGTGGSSGVTNMGHPAEALQYPDTVTTNTNGRATFELQAFDPGNPRGFIDGQIYFMDYGFKAADLSKAYVQSLDDIISAQVYTQVPKFEDVTWENFVKGVLGQYGKLYPIMNFLQLGDEQTVIKNAKEIDAYINLNYDKGEVMPVTRDLSEERLKLVSRWLQQHYKPKKCAFADKWSR